MAEGNVFACHSTEAWRSKLQEAIDTRRLVVVDFTATWCGPCRVISPVFVELSKKFPEIFFLKVDVDELRDVAQEWDVEAMPTFIFIRDGRAVDKVVGAKKDDLERKVAALAATTTEAALVAQA
uniref:Thioredoxin domain-containing protein n=1 Tax=Picea sitchensis TaxID=3332 RepID=A9NWD4_PICSI|nr:unknown [Picea sitchensis]ABK25545.1 unknown [Picea sitchensis]